MILPTLPASDAPRPFWKLAAVTAELARAADEDELWAGSRWALETLFPSESGFHAVYVNADSAPRSVWGGGRELFARLATSVTPDEQHVAIPHRLAAPGQMLLPGHGLIMWAPMLDDSGLLGLLVVEGSLTRDPFSTEEMCALASLASQVGVLMGVLTSVTSRRLQHELVLARRMQQQLIAAVPRELAGFQLSTAYQPRFEVGGDFYDVLRTGQREVTAIIGDVSGKGVGAAMLMSRVSASFRSLADTARSPAALLQRLNSELVGCVPDDTFVTAACVRYDAVRTRMTVANAGHCVPLLKRASGGVVLAGRPSGTPLGMMAGERYGNQEIVVDHGDILVMVTDGILDALDPSRGMWRLTDLVAQAPHDADEIRYRVMCEVLAAPEAITDDMALLALQQMEMVGSVS